MDNIWNKKYILDVCSSAPTFIRYTLIVWTSLISFLLLAIFYSYQITTSFPAQIQTDTLKTTIYVITRKNHLIFFEERGLWVENKKYNFKLLEMKPIKNGQNLLLTLQTDKRIFTKNSVQNISLKSNSTTLMHEIYNKVRKE